VKAELRRFVIFVIGLGLRRVALRVLVLLDFVAGLAVCSLGHGHPAPAAALSAQAFRLGLCRATQNVVARCLDLIGVEAPDRM